MNNLLIDRALIETTQQCNLRCTYCFYDDIGRKPAKLSINDFKELLSEFPNLNSFYLTGGEFFLLKDAQDILELLSEYGSTTVFTNAVLLNKYELEKLSKILACVDELIITFDSFDFNNYTHRGKDEETLEAIKKLLSINAEKIRIKICLNQFNKDYFQTTICNLKTLGTKKLSINLVHDIQASDEVFKIHDATELKQIFDTVQSHSAMFEAHTIDALKSYLLNKDESVLKGCTAGESFMFVDYKMDKFVCPANLSTTITAQEKKQCLSEDCICLWEIMDK